MSLHYFKKRRKEKRRKRKGDANNITMTISKQTIYSRVLHSFNSPIYHYYHHTASHIYMISDNNNLKFLTRRT